MKETNERRMNMEEKLVNEMMNEMVEGSVENAVKTVNVQDIAKGAVGAGLLVAAGFGIYKGIKFVTKKVAERKEHKTNETVEAE